ncbi:hypothetical protein U9M48_031988, partial [Paspalum notatum var. saurae]
MKVKEHFLELSSFNLYDSSQIRFWEDRWFGHLLLKNQYPSLYNITRKKHITVVAVFSSTPLNISFRRALVGDRLQKWKELVSEIALVQLDDQPDSFKWNLSKHGCFTVNSMYRHLVSKHGCFTVNSMYRHLVNQTALPLNKFLWKLKLPLKIKIFVWFLFKGVILTKDNLLKRHWTGDGRCCFCDTNETIQHLFFDCHIAKFVWRVVFLAFGHLQSNLLDTVMERSSKKGKRTATQVGMSISGDHSYGDFCQAR